MSRGRHEFQTGPRRFAGRAVDDERVPERVAAAQQRLLDGVRRRQAQADDVAGLRELGEGAADVGAARRGPGLGLGAVARGDGGATAGGRGEPVQVTSHVSAHGAEAVEAEPRRGVERRGVERHGEQEQRETAHEEAAHGLHRGKEGC